MKLSPATAISTLDGATFPDFSSGPCHLFDSKRANCCRIALHDLNSAWPVVPRRDNRHLQAPDCYAGPMHGSIRKRVDLPPVER
jgi:hypothetical protein